MKTSNILLVLFLLLLQNAVGQSGTLDTSFGDNGAIINSVSAKDNVKTIKTQKDRKILVLGSIEDSDTYDIILTRYLTNGALDVDFGDQGVVKTKLNGLDNAIFHKVSFQLDQKIVIIGTSNGNGIVVRYLPNGTLDTSFGDDASGILSFSLPRAVSDIAMQDDGKFLVASSTDRMIAITRFDQEGEIDTTYGVNGTVSTTPSESRQSTRRISEIFLTKENELVVIASRGGGGLGQLFIFYNILKFDSNGQFLHGYFDSKNSNVPDFVIDGAIDDTSNIYVTTTQGYVFKLDKNLDLDTTYAENGFLEMTPSDTRKIVIDNDNNSIISNNDTATGNAYLKKYTSDGTLDVSFGKEGTVLLPKSPIISNVEILTNDKILVGGTTLSATPDTKGTNSILLRYNANNTEVIESPITCFSLIDANTNAPKLILEDGGSYPINNLALSSLNIEASIATGQEFKSYKLNLEGALTVSRIENNAPYAVFGNLGDDFFGRTFPAGTYTIEAIPFTGINASGKAGVPLKISFELINQPSVLEGFVIVEAGTGNLIAVIEEGFTAKLDQDLSYSIVANTNSSTIGSVVMELSGPSLNINKIENRSPYAIFGNTDEEIFGRTLPRGDYTITGTPFSGASGTGIAGETSTLNFSITFYTKSIVSPNPISGKTVEVFFGERISHTDYIPYTIYNAAGIEIHKGGFQNNFSGISHTIDLTEKLTDRGVYILQFGPDRIQFVY